MKRSVLFAAGALFFSLLFPLFLSALYLLIIAGAVFVIAVILLIFHKKREYFIEIGCVLLVAVFGIFYMMFWINSAVTPLKQLDNTTVQISGSIIDKPKIYDDSVSYTIKIDKVDGMPNLPKTFNATLYSSSKLSVLPFDRITATVKFREMNELDNIYKAREKIFLVGSIEKGTASVQKYEGSEIIRLPLNISEYISNLFSKNMEKPQAEMLKGIVLGDVSGIDNDMRSALTDTGILHVVSVSGFHLSFLAGNLLIFLTKLKIGKNKSAMITLLFVWLIAAVAGLSPPVLRSAIMYSIMLGGLLLFRHADTLNSLGVSAIIILVINPFAAVDISFQLSFLATLGLLTLGNYLSECGEKYLPQRKIPRKIVKSLIITLSMSLSATIFTFPVILLNFDSISVISVLANILLIPPASIALMISVIAAIISPLSFMWFIWKPLLSICELLIKFFNFGTSLMAQLPFATINISGELTAICTVFILIIIAVAFIVGNKKGRIYRLAAIISILLILNTAFFNMYNDANVSEVNIIGADKNISVVITHKGQAFAVGSAVYSAYDMRSILRRKSIDKLDMLILPMLNETFAAGATDLLKINKCDILLAPQSGALYNEITTISCAKATINGAVIEYTEDLNIEIISHGDKNVVFINCFDKTILIAPPSFDMNYIDEIYRSPDIFITGTAVPTNLTTNPKTMICGTYNKTLFAADKLGIPAFICTKDTITTLIINKNGGIKTVRR